MRAVKPEPPHMVGFAFCRQMTYPGGFGFTRVTKIKICETTMDFWKSLSI